MNIKINCNIDNSCFSFAGSDIYRSGEAIAELLHGIAEQFSEYSAVGAVEPSPVVDLNGNTIGTVEITE